MANEPDGVFDNGATPFTKVPYGPINNINAQLTRDKWVDYELTYSFPDLASDIAPEFSSAVTAGFSELSNAQKNAARYWYNEYASISGLSFIELDGAEGALDEDEEATMRMFNSTAINTAFGYFPDMFAHAGDMVLGGTGDNPAVYNFDYVTIGHEIGHGLGLDHGHTGIKLDRDRNSSEYSIMTYHTFVGDTQGGNTAGTFDHPQTLMIVDIQAIQYLYGANYGFNANDSTYTFSTTTGEMFINGVGQGAGGANRVFRTIWDGNGTDTYDLGNYTTDLSIDLTPGGRTDLDVGGTAQRADLDAFGAGGAGQKMARGHLFNAELHEGDTRALIENAIAGTGDDRITGNAANNSISGGLGDDTILASAGNDVLAGGGGSGDLLSFENASAGVNASLETERTSGGAGTDTITGFEHVKGSAQNDVLTGDAGSNLLRGEAGNDTLDGGTAGSDTLIGGAGNDYYVLRDNTVFEESAGQGSADHVAVFRSYALDALHDVEILELSDTLSNTKSYSLTGNAGAQAIIGHNGRNTLRDGGPGGNDTLTGLDDDDTYWVTNTGAVVSEEQGAGFDRVITTVSYALSAAAAIERLQTTATTGTQNISLTGNANSQYILGNAGKNAFRDGGAGGRDTLIGLGGDDLYFVTNSDAEVREKSGDGFDRVVASVNYALDEDVHVERLQTFATTSTDNIALTGNTQSQYILGNAGDNTLRDGGAGGRDTLIGLDGDDTYWVNNQDAVLREKADNGFDRVITSVSFTLDEDDHIERLQTTATAGTDTIALTGNSKSQYILGNAGSNTLRDGGAAGKDTLIGLGGDDLYFVNNTDAVVRESVGAGFDRVVSTVDFALAENAHVERLQTSDTTGTSDIDLTGNRFAQYILGNAGENRLEGGRGADTLRGMGDADTFVFGDALGGGNVDRVLDFTASEDRIELDNAVFAALSQGGLSEGSFASSSSGMAESQHAQIIYNNDGGQLYYDADGSGGQAAVLFAELDAGLNLNSSDFMII